MPSHSQAWQYIYDLFFILGLKGKAPIPGTKLRYSSPMADPSQKATDFSEQGWTDSTTPPMVAFPFTINFPGELFSPAHLFRVSKQQRQGQKCWRAALLTGKPSSENSKWCCSSAQRSWGRSVPTAGFLQTQKDAFLLWKACRPRNCQIVLQTSKTPWGQCLSFLGFWVSYANG